MNTYVFYTEEGQTLSPLGDNLENYQFLDFIHEESGEKARAKLFSDNPWILISGFNPEEIHCIQRHTN